MELKLAGISKNFMLSQKAFIALDNIDLEIDSGEFVCIVGPSGCGKSTLLNMVAGLDAPSQGEIILNGSRVRAPGPDRGMIFQDPALFPWLNVIENVEFGMKQAGMSKAQRRELAMEYLSMVHLTKFASAWVHTLSGGMKQRVALARALSLNSKMLLMDEPFAALDSQTRELLYQELYEIWQRTKKTILFVTHQVEEAVLLADRVLVMTAAPGRIKAEFRLDSEPIRSIENPEVLRRVSEIKAVLKDEVMKVAQGELAGEEVGR